MARTYRWLGGIGYILGFIPYVNIASPVLVAIAWIMMGGDRRERLFTALGVMILVALASAMALIVWLFASLWVFLVGTTPDHIPSAGPVWTFIALALIMAVLAIVTFILDIAAHFRAGRVFDNRWFRVAGWTRIALVIVAVAAIPLIILTSLPAVSGPSPIMPAPLDFGAAMSLLFTLLWPLIIVIITGLLATIFSIIAFFTIPESDQTSTSA